MNDIQQSLLNTIVSTRLLSTHNNKVVQLLMIIKFDSQLRIGQNGNDHAFGWFLELGVIWLLFEFFELLWDTDHLIHEAAIGYVFFLQLYVLLAVHCYNKSLSNKI